MRDKLWRLIEGVGVVAGACAAVGEAAPCGSWPWRPRGVQSRRPGQLTPRARSRAGRCRSRPARGRAQPSCRGAGRGWPSTHLRLRLSRHEVDSTGREGERASEVHRGTHEHVP